MTAPETVAAPQATDRPRIRHRRCAECERSLCTNELVPLIPAARDSQRCNVCFDQELAFGHRRLCKGKP